MILAVFFPFAIDPSQCCEIINERRGHHGCGHNLGEDEEEREEGGGGGGGEEEDKTGTTSSTGKLTQSCTVHNNT